jgi:hypothetical protein
MQILRLKINQLNMLFSLVVEGIACGRLSSPEKAKTVYSISWFSFIA